MGTNARDWTDDFMQERSSVRLISFILIALAATVGATSSAFADGKFFRNLALARDPTIASQRAILAWRDGRETLIVESVVEAETSASPTRTAEEAGAALGWVLPLPATPDEIAAATPGTLRTMAELIQPRIYGDREGKDWTMGGATACAFTGLIALLTLGLVRRHMGWAMVAGAIGTLIMLGFLLLPALATARAGLSVAGLEAMTFRSRRAHPLPPPDETTDEQR